METLEDDGEIKKLTGEAVLLYAAADWERS